MTLKYISIDGDERRKTKRRSGTSTEIISNASGYRFRIGLNSEKLLQIARYERFYLFDLRVL